LQHGVAADSEVTDVRAYRPRDALEFLIVAFLRDSSPSSAALFGRRSSLVGLSAGCRGTMRSVKSPLMRLTCDTLDVVAPV
jgi:hypothetical protein